MAQALARQFWRWYTRHYLVNLSVATGLFLLQVFHLYWLTTDVVLMRLVGRSFFAFPERLWPLYVLIDYTEIPALISVSIVYLGSLGKQNRLQTWLALGALNVQWIHIFWITDEVVFETLSGQVLLGWPAWAAWIAILIDYLELPVMVDTVGKLRRELREVRAGGRLERWRQHWRSEGDAAFLYRALAGRERDATRAALYRRLAASEDDHVGRWREVLVAAGAPPSAYRPGLRVRTLAALGRVVGWQLLATILLAEENREMQEYGDGADEAPGTDSKGEGPGRDSKDERGDGAASGVVRILAGESAEHADQLAALLEVSPRARRRVEPALPVRRALLGVHGGLTAAFAVSLGLRGAGQPSGVVVTATAAALAGLILAAAGNAYLAAKSGITLSEGSALREGLAVGGWTALGAGALLLFLAVGRTTPLWTLLGGGLALHFATGIVRGLLTGHSALRAGVETALVGLGIGAAGYAAGIVVSGLL